MENISTQLEVVETCSALSRLRVSAAVIGVVNADLFATYQGTTVPFAGHVADVRGRTMPQLHKGVSSGTKVLSPPV